MIMAMMVEVAAQRMLTNRPTVALTSDPPVWPAASSPSRAMEPRTEITRPKDVTMYEPGLSGVGLRNTMQAVVGETVKHGSSAPTNPRRPPQAFVLRAPRLDLIGVFTGKSAVFAMRIGAGAGSA